MIDQVPVSTGWIYDQLKYWWPFIATIAAAVKAYTWIKDIREKDLANVAEGVQLLEETLTKQANNFAAAMEKQTSSFGAAMEKQTATNKLELEHQTAGIRLEIERQTVGIVSELKELRADFRNVSLRGRSTKAAKVKKAINANKKIKVD